MYKDKIYLFSTNIAKVEAVKTVFSDYAVEKIKVDLDKKQPLSEAETIEMARERTKSRNDGIRIGLEAGVTKIGEKCFLCNFGVLIDEEGNEYVAGGSYFLLPDTISNELYLNHLELKDAIKKVYGKEVRELGGTIEFLTKGEVKRVDIFIHICKILKGLYDKKKGEKNA